MKRVYKTLKALGLLIRDPWKLNLILDQNEEWEVYIRKHHQLTSLPVIPLHTLVLDPVTVEPCAFLDGGSSVTDLALLKQLASAIPGCRYFEIGTWRGESVSNVASVAEVCYSLNLPDEDLLKMIKSKEYLASHRVFSRKYANIIHLTGDSRNFDYKGLGLKFDMIYIDGDHHYETVFKDTRNVLEYLCHHDTIIVWHDYTYTPESIRYETLAAILDASPADLHPRLYHVSNTNCAILCRNEVSSFPFVKYARPEYSFAVQVKISPLNESGKSC